MSAEEREVKLAIEMSLAVSPPRPPKVTTAEAGTTLGAEAAETAGEAAGTAGAAALVAEAAEAAGAAAASEEVLVTGDLAGVSDMKSEGDGGAVDEDDDEVVVTGDVVGVDDEAGAAVRVYPDDPSPAGPHVPPTYHLHGIISHLGPSPDSVGPAMPDNACHVILHILDPPS